jgi:alkyl sulfatase BDS1-like metallo-beta-lactamase superfamily hydrolase
VTVPDFNFDPQRAFEQVRRIAAEAPAHLAEGFGRVVRDVPPERLEQVMRSPARKPLLDGIFWQMPKQLDAEQAIGVTTAIRWDITGRADGEIDTYLLQVDNGRAKTDKQSDGQPVAGADAANLTITMDGVELLRLVSGNLDPMQAYFKGRIQLTGDIMVAAKMAQMFRMPGGSGSGETPPDAPNGPAGPTPG